MFKNKIRILLVTLICVVGFIYTTASAQEEKIVECFKSIGHPTFGDIFERIMNNSKSNKKDKKDVEEDKEDESKEDESKEDED